MIRTEIDSLPAELDEVSRWTGIPVTRLVEGSAVDVGYGGGGLEVRIRTPEVVAAEA